MVRLQQRWEVLYGHFADFMNNLEEVNAVARNRGWAEFAPWTPASGKANEVVLISDFPDFATYKQEEAASYADPEFMKAWRQGAQFVVRAATAFRTSLRAQPRDVRSSAFPARKPIRPEY